MAMVMIDKKRMNEFLTSQRFTFKMIIAILLAIAVSYLLHQSPHNLMWVIITIFVAMDVRVESTLQLSRYRVVGTAIGVIVAAILLQYFDVGYWPQMCIVLIIVSLVSAQVQLFGKGIRTAGVGAATVIFMGTAGHTWEFAYWRFLDISLGVMYALLVSVLIFPGRTVDVMIKNVDKLLEMTKTIYQNLLENEPISSLNSYMQNMQKLLDKNTALIEDLRNKTDMRSKQVLALNQRVLELYLHIYNMVSMLPEATLQILKADMREELLQMLHCTSGVIEIWREAISSQQYQMKITKEKQHEALQCIERLDRKFQVLRSEHLFNDFTETEILVTYSFLYHVKEILETLVLPIRDLTIMRS